MTTARYSVAPHPIETLLSWVKSGEIAIPEIQRPFVWDATKVRNLLDSLYKGYPIGYLIAWRNPAVRLKDGTLSSGKRILIDGQQRVTALMAALLGREVLTKDYELTTIRIAFHPVAERFEVANPAIRKDVSWIPDIAPLFSGTQDLLETVDSYCDRNPTADRRTAGRVVQSLLKLTSNQVGIIELAEDLDIETVTEIFIRVNSAGAALSQADFAMSKIAADQRFGGSELRKAIDYFCHLATAPEFYRRIQAGDQTFANTEYFRRMTWLKSVSDDLYDPSYTDMLRVAFTSEFHRGKLQDLVALLSGRNFETKQYEEEVAEESFRRLKNGVLAFMDETHFKRMVMILRGAGFITSDLMGGQNAVNFAYILYLRGRADGVPAADLERLVRRWYVMAMLTQRYSGNPETAFDADIRAIATRGLVQHADATIAATLSDSYWTTLLPQQLETSSTNSPYWRTYLAAQVKHKDNGFLSRDISVADLLLNRSDVHHVYPKAFLKKEGAARSLYNQIANFVLAQSEINIAIGERSPSDYFGALSSQVKGGTRKFGGITDDAQLTENLQEHCIPLEMLSANVPEYRRFLEVRRQLMAAKMRRYFESL